MKATTGSDTVYYTRGFELISKRDGSAASCFIYDGGLSVRALTNEAGTVTDTLVFDAFGNETVKTGSTDNAYGFQGEEKDETGLYYLRARYMDPSTGTFTSMDTYGGSLSDPMSLHKYMFANSNPVMYSDPSGHFSLVEFELSEAIDQILMSSLNYAIAYAGIIQNSNTSLSDNEKLAGYFAAMGVGLLMPFVFSAIALLPFVGALLVTLVLAIALGVGSYFAGKNGHEREAVILGIASGDCVGNAIGLSINKVVQWLNESNLVQAEAKRRNGSWYKADGSKNYPPDLGAIPETETEITLREGDIIGRYGEIRYNSDFVTEGGVNPDKLSLPPWTSPTDYQEFMVTGDIPSVIRSVISPWGDSFGLGLQYKLPIPIKELIEKGLLVPF